MSLFNITPRTMNMPDGWKLQRKRFFTTDRLRRVHGSITIFQLYGGCTLCDIKFQRLTSAFFCLVSRSFQRAQQTPPHCVAVVLGRAGRSHALRLTRLSVVMASQGHDPAVGRSMCGMGPGGLFNSSVFCPVLAFHPSHKFKIECAIFLSELPTYSSLISDTFHKDQPNWKRAEQNVRGEGAE